MGKRSTNSTKGGKFMNPTDQARKEARRKELRKNKKQRQLVRHAVLKGKNPREIIYELEKVDDMEFNVHSPTPLNEKVLRDKRRKLNETWNRVMELYGKEDLEQFLELKKLWMDYLRRKNEQMQRFNSVKNAQNVTVDDIPLPSLPDGSGPNRIPLPPQKGSILKKTSFNTTSSLRQCPGVPASYPPPLSHYMVGVDDDLGDTDQGIGNTKERHRKIRFEENEENDTSGIDLPAEEMTSVDSIQRKILQISGHDVNHYMKEMEEVHRQSQRSEFNTEPDPPGVESGSLPHRFKPGVAPPNVMLPPGPPPGLPPVLRIPPGPPPGMPSVVSAAPQLLTKSSGSSVRIEAKPQMRNLKSDLVRFVPTNVRLKKVSDDSRLHDKNQNSKGHASDVFSRHVKQHKFVQKSKDDAYAQFMKEMGQIM